VSTPEPELHYAIEILPPGRLPFKRWRYELWSGQVLLASGWRTSERQVERALRTHAARHAHRVLGVHPLRLEAAAFGGAFRPGAPARVVCGGPVTCLLLPRTPRPDAI
jgi:hypothetical protein